MSLTDTAFSEAEKSAERAGRKLGGKYMTFKLAEEEYGLQILKVRDVIGLMEITRVPRTQPYIRGVINLRGKVIPVVDLRVKFGMKEAVLTEHTVIIVVQFAKDDRKLTMGILVDEVLEVLDISDDKIEPTPDFGAGSIDTDFILGIGKSEQRVIFLLEIGKVLSAEQAGEHAHSLNHTGWQGELAGRTGRVNWQSELAE